MLFMLWNCFSVGLGEFTLELDNCSHAFVFSSTVRVLHIPVPVKHGAIRSGLFPDIEFLSFHYENALSRNSKLCLTRWRNQTLACLLFLAAGIRPVVSVAAPRHHRILDFENSNVCHQQERLTCVVGCQYKSQHCGMT